MEQQRKSVGAFWLKEKKDRDGNPMTVLSGNIDLGHTTVNIVKNKYKQPGETKPDYYAYPATFVQGQPRVFKKEEEKKEEVPF